MARGKSLHDRRRATSLTPEMSSARWPRRHATPSGSSWTTGRRRACRPSSGCRTQDLALSLLLLQARRGEVQAAHPDPLLEVAVRLTGALLRMASMIALTRVGRSTILHVESSIWRRRPPGGPGRDGENCRKATWTARGERTNAQFAWRSWTIASALREPGPASPTQRSPVGPEACVEAMRLRARTRVAAHP